MLNILRKITPRFLLSWYHFLWAFVSAVRYAFPSRGMVVIGVTGTNGKSTTVDMTSRILREAGFSVASMSSVRFQVKDKEWRNTMKMTMPGRFVIQRFLRQAKTAGCSHVVLEVTSEGMLQHRHRFISFHTAVFTNLSAEHIERHGSFERYKLTKAKLFRAAKGVHVLNGDDKHVSFFLRFSAKQKYLYSIDNQAANGTHLQATNVQTSERGVFFSLRGVDFRLRLLGRFQVSNALASVSVALSQGISLETSKKALEEMQRVPGRMEEVVSAPFRVIVDYAFTPAALEKVYKTFKSKIQNPKSKTNSKAQNPKLICILGAAGGGRDTWKRPVLGRIAAQYCDTVLVTNEDPYEEDPEKIMQEVLSGTAGKGEKVPERREAIAKALNTAQPGDAVVITGKGSEDSIAVAGGKKVPWDDREVVREEMARHQG